MKSLPRSSKKSIQPLVGTLALILGAIALPLIGLKLLVRSTATAESAEVTPAASPVKVVALGRIEPVSGVVKVGGPMNEILDQLLVKEGDWVKQKQVIGYLKGYEERQSELEKTKQQLQAAQWRLGAETQYSQAQLQERTLESVLTPAVEESGVAGDRAIAGRQAQVTPAQSNTARTQSNSEIETAKQAVQLAEVVLENTIIRTPQAGQILRILTKQGERIGGNGHSKGGIVEIADTRTMQVIAEVNESDIRLVKPGQVAKIVSRNKAFTEPFLGQVIEIGTQIYKSDLLNDDPSAMSDARVIEVKLRLLDSKPVRKFTNLQVDAQIEVQSPAQPFVQPSIQPSN